MLLLGFAGSGGPRTEKRIPLKITMRTATGDSSFFNVVRGYDLGFETRMHKFAHREFKMLQLRRESRSDWNRVELIGSDICW